MKNTLKRNNEIRYILKKGTFYNSKLLCIYIIKNNRNTNRLGIIVSKKIGKAVKRNMVKRKIREVYRKYSLISGYDVLIMWKNKNDYKKANYNDILIEMKKIFIKADILL